MTNDCKCVKCPSYAEWGIITEKPQRPEYALKETRKRTFDNWPADHHLTPEDLSKAGFFYGGYGDCALCFYCGGGLRNWEDEDDVWVEHARWFPKCAYIRQQMGQVFVDTVQELNKTSVVISMDMVKNKGKDIKHDFSRVTDDDKGRIGPSYAELEIIIERPKRPEYALREIRKGTFHSWPADHHLKPEDLSDAGFYYAGYSDYASCFYCGGGLGNWEDEDDVWVEHARWFPKCAYIRQQMGQHFVNTVQEMNKNSDVVRVK